MIRFIPRLALVACLAALGVAGAAERAAPQRGYVFDNRYQHGHYYPQAGTRFHALPPGNIGINYRGVPYRYYGGSWYRPWYGGRFIVVAPPIGIGIAVRPPYYTTVWFAGMPYYYADNTYYLWQPTLQQYVVTEPPTGVEPSTTQPTGNPELFAYPQKGQSEAQQAEDRFACHQWARQQSGFDPTQPLGGVAATDVAARRADYQRAQRSCLEGRGYSVQ